MKTLYFLSLVFTGLAGRVFADQDEEFKNLFQKDYWAFEQLSEQKDTALVAPPIEQLETPHHKPSKLSKAIEAAAPLNAAPTILTFSKDTVWASVKVTVTDKHGSYNFNVQSDSLVTGWEIDTDDKQLVKKGDVNSMNVFGVDINQNFTNNLVLNLAISKDDQTNNIYINLH